MAVETPLAHELWLRVGQSNSLGINGDFLAMPEDVLDPRAVEFSQGKSFYGNPLIPAGQIMPQYPAGQDALVLPSGESAGPSLYFAKRRILLNPDIQSIMMVNNAQGSSASFQWLPDKKFYQRSVGMVVNALEVNTDYRFAGIIWHQGETDAAFGVSQQDYSNRLKIIIDGLRANIPNGIFSKLVVGTLPEPWMQQNEPFRRFVDNALRNISSYIDNSGFADLSDLPIVDAIHYGSGGQRIAGSRYADIVQDI